MIRQVCLGVIVLGMALLACKGSRDGSAQAGGSEGEHYWSSGCIPREETNVLTLGGDVTARLDLSNGSRIDGTQGYRKALACLPDGTTTDIGPHSSVVDVTPKGQVVSFLAIDDSVRWDQLQLSRGAAPKSIDLAIDKFRGIDARNAQMLVTVPVRATDDGKILIAAGAQPNFVNQGVGDPRSLAFYELDPSTETTTPWAPMRAPDRFIQPSSIVAAGATRDGRIIATVHRTQAQKDVTPMLVVGHQKGTGAETFRHEIVGAREPTEVAMSDSGKLCAVGLTLPGGRRSRLDVIAVSTGARAWSTSFDPGTIIFARFLKDESLVIATSKRTAARFEGTTGQQRWRFAAQ